MKRFLSLAILLTLFLSACGSAVTPTPTVVSLEVKPKTLAVFAAASLTDAFAEIGKDFEAANSGVTVKFNFAGSQSLRTQIEEGAPADVFASANNKEMDTLIADKLISEGIAQNFLANKLIVILPENNPARIEKLEDLAKPKMKLVLAAEAVPVGKYALQSLDLMDASFGNDFEKKVLANVVSNEDNVKQVVAKVQLGEADGGIVYISDKIAAPGLKTVDIPAELNVVAKYPIAPLAKSANAETAKVFIDYVLSSDGQSVLQKWGFTPVK